MALVMDSRFSAGMRRWNLRFGITSRCNIRCRYCLPEGSQGVVPAGVLVAACQAGARPVVDTDLGAPDFVP